MSDSKNANQCVVYMLRTCGEGGVSRNGHVYPLIVGEVTECKDWDQDPRRECGGGLHGLPNGIGDANLIPQGKGLWWQVYAVESADCFPAIDGKARWRRGTLVFSQRQATEDDTTARDAAVAYLAERCPRTGIVWDRVTSGNGGQSTSGNGGQSTSGYGGQSTSGYGGQSTSGYWGQSTSGYWGQCRAGIYGGILIRYWDKDMSTYRVKAGEVGCGDGSDGLLKADTWYRVNEKGDFVEVKA